jgi:hypothetical protein
MNSSNTYYRTVVTRCLRPNPSLKLTRYGRRCMPSLNRPGFRGGRLGGNPPIFQGAQK